MFTKEHLDNTIKLWYSTMTELEGMKAFLTVEKINNKFYRRLFIRNIFSIIETYIFVTKEIVKIKLTIEGNESDKVSWSELAILNERKAALDKKGNVEVKEEFQSFIPSLRFSLNIFARIFNSSLPDFGNSNFEKLQQLAKRRNDITHPKSLNDLNITDQEVRDTLSMFSWFMTTHNNINKDFIEWLRSNYGKL